MKGDAASPVKAMKEGETAEFARALKVWTGVHPCPDEPAWQTTDGRSHTPRELAEAVKQRTALGRLQLETFDFAINGGLVTFDQLAADR